MFKPMTLSLSLVLALTATSASMAGGPWNSDCPSCGVTASAQASPQGPSIVTASPQSGWTDCAPSCPTVLPSCGMKKFCFSLPTIKLPKIQCPKFRLEKYTVTKTKYRLVKCWPAPSCETNCGSCDSCASAPSWPTTYPSSQSVWGSSQGAPAYAAPQYAAPQYAAPQYHHAAPASSGQAVISTPAAPAMAPAAPAAPAMAPPAPEAPKADGAAKTSGALILDPVTR